MVLVACGGPESEEMPSDPPPDFVTKHGISVFTNNLVSQVLDIETATEVFSDYGAIASKCENGFPFESLVFYWMPADERGAFIDPFGRAVKGYASGGTMFVGYPSAGYGSVVHEMAHALRYLCSGVPDKDHSGWNETVYPALQKMVKDPRILAMVPTAKSMDSLDNHYNCTMD